ncbi:polysaccharide lyase [Defluviimonas sp. WL0075]|uniref:Polysaccharide lyase n=1 Tax=Albidovulum sediminicola TaxID=2984331 RepID=A0ABT2YYI7_9RHOB|nr:polysaccharide lyase [Defluviimonas sp. WL0075]MCV2863933.1 polysaccharide lyase [Defluviimonas sp. WL0075]
MKKRSIDRTMPRALRICAFVWAALAAGVSAPAWGQNFKPYALNGENPKRAGGTWTMTLTEGLCQDVKYGDGRGESDCGNGNLRSQLQGPDIAPGREVEYAFDVFVPKSFEYRESLKYRTRGSVEIAGWQHIRAIKNHLFEMNLKGGGVTFEDHLCFDRKRFGAWNSVRVLVKWSLREDGFLRVLCNGKQVYALAGQTLIPPACGTSAKTNCHVDKLAHRNPIRWVIGPWYRGFGSDWKDYGRASPFLPFPRNGISIKVRNLYQGKLRNS